MDIEEFQSRLTPCHFEYIKFLLNRHKSLEAVSAIEFEINRGIINSNGYLYSPQNLVRGIIDSNGFFYRPMIPVRDSECAVISQSPATENLSSAHNRNVHGSKRAVVYQSPETNSTKDPPPIRKKMDAVAFHWNMSWSMTEIKVLSK